MSFEREGNNELMILKEKLHPSKDRVARLLKKKKEKKKMKLKYARPE
jgi:hypothetical protein